MAARSQVVARCLIKLEIRMAIDRRPSAKKSTRRDQGPHSFKPARHSVSSSARIPELRKADDKLLNQICRDISAISIYMMRVAEHLGQRIGISGPQGMILTTIEELSDSRGLSVKAVAALLHVDASFVSAQSKMLESRNLIRRRRLLDDRRVTRLFLTESASTYLARLSRTRARMRECICADLDHEAFSELSSTLSGLRDRVRREMLKIAVGE